VPDSGRPPRKPASRLAARFAAWLSHGQDRRSGPRTPIPMLCAYYWEGGLSTPHKVLNVSETGAYIATPARWYLGTVIELTIQKETGAGEALLGPHSVLRVPSRVVRCDPDGTGVRFVYSRSRARRHVREFLAAMRGSEGDVSGMSSGGTRRRGQALLEFALIALLFLSLVFVSLNFFFWTFAKAAVHSAVREGARYAITGRTNPLLGQDASIRQVVRNNAFGLLNSAPDSSITVEYFAADGSGATSSNAAGNIVVVSVVNYTPNAIAPLLGFQNSIHLSVRAVDKVEPYGGVAPARTSPSP
jgi:Flp pilus assembly protein TadG